MPVPYKICSRSFDCRTILLLVIRMKCHVIRNRNTRFSEKMKNNEMRCMNHRFTESRRLAHRSNVQGSKCYVDIRESEMRF